MAFILVIITMFLIYSFSLEKHEEINGLVLTGEGLLAYEDIESGFYKSNSFTVTNNGSSKYCYSLKINNFINTFASEGHLEYQVLKDNSVLIGYTDVPKSSVQTDTSIFDGICIETGSTHSYTVNIRYNGSSSLDEGGVLSGTFAIGMTRYSVEGRSNNSNGNVTSSSVTYGGNTTLTVTPSMGYYLESASCTNGYTISDMLVGENTMISQLVTVNNNGKEVGSTCTFNFRIRTFTVEINVTNGTTTSANPQIVNYGTGVSFDIVPDEGYYLSPTSAISGGCGFHDVTSINVLNVTEDMLCEVTLQMKTYNVTLSYTTEINSQNTSQNGTRNAYVNHGSSKTFDLSDLGSSIDYDNASITSGGCTISGSIVSFDNVTENKSCQVYLPLKTYSATLTVNGGNTSTINPQTVKYGYDGVFNISASTGHNLSAATVTSGNCTLSSNKQTVTFSNVTSARSCTVSIPINTYTATLTCNNCSTTSTNPQTVNYNSNAQWTITVASGYTLTGANVSGCTINGTTITAANVTSNRSCTVTAALDLSMYIGYYWVIDSSTITAYNASGTQLSSTSTSSTFSVPYTATYSIELHGGGGGQGGHNDSSYYCCAHGGAGGGSGQLFENVSLTANTPYAISIGLGGTSGSGWRCVSCGGAQRGDGGSGTAGGATTFGSYSVNGGDGGTTGTLCYRGCSTGSCLVGSVGGYQGSAYGNLASDNLGGSTIGTYGNGAPLGCTSESGQNGAIIIRLTSI